MTKELKSKSSMIQSLTVRGYLNPIRSQNKEQVEQELRKAIFLIAIKYGQKEIPKILVSALISDTFENWSKFGVEEILQAFNLWSLGKLGEYKMYGLNCESWNTILSMYDNWRRKELKDFKEIESAKRRKKEMEEKEKHARKEFENMPDKEIIQAVKKSRTFRDVPIWAARLAWKRKLYRVTDLMLDEYATRSEQFVKLDYESRLKKAKTRRERRDIENVFDLQSERKNLGLQLMAYERL